MSDLLSLAEAEGETAPQILPVDARVAVSGQVSNLLPMMERAAAVAPAKEVIKGTSLVKIETHPGKAGALPYTTVTSTNGMMTSTVATDLLSVHMVGAALVPARKIVEVLRMAPSETFRLEVLGTTVQIRSGRAMWAVQTEPGESLAPAPSTEDIKTHVVPVGPFLTALQVAMKAASVSMARNSLRQIQVKSGALTGADGSLLHRHAVPGLPKSLDTTIPIDSAPEIVRLLKSATSETFEFGSNYSHLLLRVGQDEVIAQRMLVPYPNLENQILGPALTNGYTLSVDRTELLETVKRIRINADPDYRALFLNLVPVAEASDGLTWTLTVSAQDRQGNTAQETLEVAWSGPKGARALCVSHLSLTNFLSVQQTQTIALKIGDDSKDARQPLFVENDAHGFTGWVQQVRPSYLG